MGIENQTQELSARAPLLTAVLSLQPLPPHQSSLRTLKMGLHLSLALYAPLSNVATLTKFLSPGFLPFGCFNWVLEDRWLNLTFGVVDCDPRFDNKGDTL